MLFIYILKLENDKYYIGKTKNPDFRINNHFNKAGSYWTLMHKPLEVIELIENCDEFDEDKYTKKYMSIYGIDNVRGGSYCEIVFSSQTRQFIKRELNSATDKCFYCGNKGHFIQDCEYYNIGKMNDSNKTKNYNNNSSINSSNSDSDSDSNSNETKIYSASKKLSKQMKKKYYKNKNSYNYKNSNNHKLNIKNNYCYKCCKKGHHPSTCNF